MGRIERLKPIIKNPYVQIAIPSIMLVFLALHNGKKEEPAIINNKVEQKLSQIQQHIDKLPHRTRLGISITVFNEGSTLLWRKPRYPRGSYVQDRKSFSFLFDFIDMFRHKVRAFHNSASVSTNNKVFCCIVKHTSKLPSWFFHLIFCHRGRQNVFKQYNQSMQ